MAYTPHLVDPVLEHQNTEKKAEKSSDSESVITVNSESFVQVHAPSLQPELFILHRIVLPTDKGYAVLPFSNEETTTYYQNLFNSSICINAP